VEGRRKRVFFSRAGCEERRFPRSWKRLSRRVAATTVAFFLFQGIIAENNFAKDRNGCLIYKSAERQKGTLAASQDRMWAVDKYRHFVASALVFGLVFDLLRVEGQWNQRRALAAGVSLSLGLGVAKELWDRNRPGHVASWKDLLADAAGVTFGLLCFAVATR